MTVIIHWSKMLKCPFCVKTFIYRSRLDLHMVTHTKEKPHKCPRCPQAFGLKSNLKEHIKTIHNDFKPTRNKNHQCTMCTYKCYSKSMLQAHVRKHSPDLPFSCHRPGCGCRTKYKSALSQHAHQAHSDKRPFKCTLDGCSYKAKTRTHIKEHLKIHSNDKPFTCTVLGCSYKSKSKNYLQTHTSTVHSNEKPFKCSVCDFRTKFNTALKPHELTHTNNKRFQCQVPNCGYASHQRNSLKVHIDRKHRTDEVLCTEPRCNFRCGSITLLNLHLKRHQLAILKCPSDSCCYTSRYKQNLLKHISRKHFEFQSSVTVLGPTLSGLKTAEEMNTLQCSFTDCSFQTKFRQHYDRHVITHKKNEKGQYVCSFCSSRFTKWSLLEAHVQRHIREKPYRCSHCYYTTADSSQFKRHARKIHYIHVVPRGKDDQVLKCRTCGRNCFSNSESVLHSMSHLKPIVVLEQLKFHVL